MTEGDLVELATRTAELCEVDKAGPLVFRDPDTGRWMVDEGHGSMEDGRLYALPEALPARDQRRWVVDSPVLADLVDHPADAAPVAAAGPVLAAA